MHIPKRYLLYQQKYVAPYVNMLLQVVSFFAHLAAVALIVCAILEFGFELSAQLRHEFAWLYFCVWITFLVDRISHLILKKSIYWKSEYSFWGWAVNALLALTLLPIIVKVVGIDDSTGVMSQEVESGLDDGRQFPVHHTGGLGSSADAALCPSWGSPVMGGFAVYGHQCCLCDGLDDHRCTYYIYCVWADGHHAIDTDRWLGCDDHHQFLRPFLYG